MIILRMYLSLRGKVEGMKSVQMREGKHAAGEAYRGRCSQITRWLS